MENAAANAAGQAIMNTAEQKVNENGDSCCPQMSFQQRVFWFCLTGILGFGIIFYTFAAENPYYLAAGTALAITSTFFLNGWEAQKKKIIRSSEISMCYCYYRNYYCIYSIRYIEYRK